MFPKNADTYFIVVIIDKRNEKVVGTATMLIERKFLRSTGLVSNFLLYVSNNSAGTLRM